MKSKRLCSENEVHMKGPGGDLYDPLVIYVAHSRETQYV